MAKKIILYLSAYNPNNTTPAAYECPAGGPVEGVQTNDAPVKYLLREHPGISEILCLVTTEAEKKAWGRFQGVVREANPEVQCHPIFIPAGKDFAQDILPEVISKTQKDDEIFLETTGGFRDAVMYLLLISRALSYAGVRIAGAVYSLYKKSNNNEDKNKITDAMPIIRLFDLIGGMQEAASFGNVRTLREYYGDPAQDAHIEALLSAMEGLWGTIALCRTEQLPERMEAFNAAMDGAEKHADPLMRALLPAFRQKYGKKMTIPGVIKWCVESDMLQQALTIYKERIPGYILDERRGILAVKANAAKPRMKPEYVSEEEARFYEQFLKMGPNMRKGYLGYAPQEDEGEHPAVVTLKHLQELMPLSFFTARCDVERLWKVAADYAYIRMLRNMVNHANDQEGERQSSLAEYLHGYGYKLPAETDADYVRKAITAALENLRLCPRKEFSK